ncbi:MAG: hypothetical protein AAF236_06610 [Verrucomicrobiota bacterium]
MVDQSETQPKENKFKVVGEKWDQLQSNAELFRKVCAGAVLLPGVISFFLFLAGGRGIAKHAEQVSSIRSIGGETMDEAFYEHFGNALGGFAKVCYGFGFCSLGLFFAAAVCIWLSEKRVGDT